MVIIIMNEASGKEKERENVDRSGDADMAGWERGK